MKTGRKIALGLAALAVGCALVSLSGKNRAQRDLEKARRSLKEAGFKVDLSEFDLTLPAEAGRRAAALATTTREAITNRRPMAFRGVIAELMRPVGKDVALVDWKQDSLNERYSASSDAHEFWPNLRADLDGERDRLDAAMQAALAGPIRFEPIGQGAPAMLPYLADLRNLETAFATRTMLALHDGQQDVAWTNLMAASCLATEYRPEPIEVSHLVRLACVALAYNVVWNALQNDQWNDERLADLQHRWDSLDLWRGLPQTAAYGRATMADTCQRERQQPAPPWGISFSELVQRPKFAWARFQQGWSRRTYRNKGSYEDEKAILLYFRDRELNLRGAVKAATWQEMRALPGVTNDPPFVSRSPSSTLATMNMQRMNSRSASRGRGLLGRTAEAETMRRLIVTAIALERYHRLHDAYPEGLQQLVPGLISSLPQAFMDGQPLRYHRTEDGHFVLYSVGLNCNDDGGDMRPPNGSTPLTRYRVNRFQSALDLVWPRPASATEAERFHQEQRQAQQQAQALAEEYGATMEWERAAARQRKVETILSAPRPALTNEPAYQGRALSDLLRNPQNTATNRPSLLDMLSLRQVVTGSEPEIVTFQVSLGYNALTNLASLQLCIDFSPDEDRDDGLVGDECECKRGTDGNCLLAWNTIYSSPGKHALAAVLVLNQPANLEQPIIGPPLPWIITNLCQFSSSSGHFDPGLGVSLLASLQESNAIFAVDFKSTAGDLLNTIAGNTTTGVLKVHWDLRDKQGNLCTNQEFNTVLQITLPESGRSQTLKGP